jgi:hypothetical protein
MNDWRYGLHSGDEVQIDNGGPELSPSVTICEIQYIGDAARILTTDGERIECLVSEIS